MPAPAFLKYRGISLVSIYVDGYTASALSTEKLSGSSPSSVSSTSTSEEHTEHPERGAADSRAGGALSKSDLKSRARHRLLFKRPDRNVKSGNWKGRKRETSVKLF